jgi:TonB dependent receptor/Carboxypeptidase regulatory-like domain/TonB-dependent Receptor Plug Domain
MGVFQSWLPLKLISCVAFCQCVLTVVLSAGPATIFGTVRGFVHDPTDRSIPGAQVTIRSRTSNWTHSATSDSEGGFEFNAVAVREYVVSVMAAGFGAQEQQVTVVSGSAPILRFAMKIAGVEQSVEVSASTESITTQSSTPVSIVSRQEIARTPGADRTNSLSMITDYVPGTYFTHDQLHIRGGHAVTWAFDGVPIPNTNIASNVGPHVDPKNIDYLEVLRGSYTADYGDRTYGVFNVSPRTGFERNKEAEVVTSFGNFYQNNSEVSFGDHTQRFAYFVSANGNRSDLGLETPTSAVIHDRQNGFGGFGSLVFNVHPRDQLRLVTSVRKDFYQVPNDPDGQAAGVRDVERESDAVVDFSWVHALGSGLLLAVSPFYHFNRANFIGGNDPNFNVQQNRASNYGGAQAVLSAVVHKNNAHAGFYGFAQRDSTQLNVQATDGSGFGIGQKETPTGNLEAFFVEDEYQAASWLRLNGGVRVTRFAGSISENAANPRAGAAIVIPRLKWTLRGFYGRFYQAPPLSTVSGPLLDFVLDQGFAFIPLHGERDEERQFGVTIPVHGWSLDVDNFRTHARNFFDHNPVGSSNVFFPLTIDRARIRGTEATIRSPRLLNRAQVHLAYSHQYAEGFGTVNGGLTDFSVGEEGFFLDHDQRNTLSTGFDVDLPQHAWANGNIYYGSGFTDGEGPGHLPGHTTVDLALGKSIGENLSVTVTALNLANRRFLLDNSMTFAGGAHFFHPREIFAQVKYRFSY